MNWFGVKLGQKDAAPTVATGKTTATSTGTGVGKYLNASEPKAAPTGTKRSAEPFPSVPDDGKKKRKLGFGNFDAW